MQRFHKDRDLLCVQKLLFLLFFTLIVSVFFYATLQFKYITEEFQLTPIYTNAKTAWDIKATTGPENVKYILFWTPMFTKINWYLQNSTEGSEYFEKVECPITDCVLTSNQSLLSEVHMYDAILFHGVEKWIFEEIKPKSRKQDQFYVMSLLESPYQTWHDFQPDSNVFNWTMTYRFDSDVLWSYGHFKNKTNEHIIAPAFDPPWMDPIFNDQDKKSTDYQNLLETAKRKTKFAAWFVSNCNAKSHRQDLVNVLQNYFHIDIYGKCGTFSCPLKDRDVCAEKLENDYKFYLSFENSLCIDYVTEKVFRIMQNNIIPVVYGGANYSKFLPPHSYINANDFLSAKDLAKFLNNLSEQPEEYIKYFWWKKYYTVDDQFFNLCNLCLKLHDKDATSMTKIYHNMHTWWRDKTCTDKPNIIF